MRHRRVGAADLGALQVRERRLHQVAQVVAEVPVAHALRAHAQAIVSAVACPAWRADQCPPP